MKKLSLLSIILIFICTFSLKADENKGKVYQVISEESTNIPREYYSFLENVSHQLTYKDLSEASWNSKMKTVVTLQGPQEQGGLQERKDCRHSVRRKYTDLNMENTGFEKFTNLCM